MFFNSKYLKRNEITYYKCIERMIFDGFNDKDDLNLLHLIHHKHNPHDPCLLPQSSFKGITIVIFRSFVNNVYFF